MEEAPKEHWSDWDLIFTYPDKFIRTNRIRKISTRRAQEIHYVKVLHRTGSAHVPLAFQMSKGKETSGLVGKNEMMNTFSSGT